VNHGERNTRLLVTVITETHIREPAHFDYGGADCPLGGEYFFLAAKEDPGRFP
jgi:hypothetical protein